MKQGHRIIEPWAFLYPSQKPTNIGRVYGIRVVRAKSLRLAVRVALFGGPLSKLAGTPLI